jgi:hypothetical protein
LTINVLFDTGILSLLQLREIIYPHKASFMDRTMNYLSRVGRRVSGSTVEKDDAVAVASAVK